MAMVMTVTKLLMVLFKVMTVSKLLMVVFKVMVVTCQVPRLSLPSERGTVRLEPRKHACHVTQLEKKELER